ncbi:hypothetical protein Ndes2526A_g05495 [Nannochloris sp. 'desiccata']
MLVTRQVLRPLIKSRSISACRLHSSSFICRSSAIGGIENAHKLAELSLGQIAQVELYLDTLFDWNTRMNLTAVNDRKEAYIRHIEDSLSLLPALDACVAAQASDRHPTISIIDVGSGAGLPGIVLAVARPEWQITLLDSLKKRCTFNEAAVEATGLKNVKIEWGRAEDAGQDPRLREQHTIAVARAVAELRQLAELCLPLVSVGGYWIAAKGTNPQAEVEAAENAIKELGGKLMEVQEVDSDGPDGKRCVVIVKKAGFTKKKIPSETRGAQETALVILAIGAEDLIIVELNYVNILQLRMCLFI